MSSEGNEKNEDRGYSPAEYDLGVFNGELGRIVAVSNADMTLHVRFLPDQRKVEYQLEKIAEFEMAYAITIHKAQGSEFKSVILPVLTQHFRMLFRDLIYTGLTRARKLAVFVGTRKAIAIMNKDTALRELVDSGYAGYSSHSRSSRASRATDATGPQLPAG